MDLPRSPYSDGYYLFTIDPGPEQSGWILFDDSRVVESGVSSNYDVRRRLLSSLEPEVSVWVELFEPRGKSLGRGSLDTLLWTGRFAELTFEHFGREAFLVERAKTKLELLGTTRATKADVRGKVIEVLGSPGTKKAPGPTYGVVSHAWDALALAIYGDRMLRSQLEYK